MSCNCFCKGHDNYYECPVMYFDKPSYPVPAKIMVFEYWPGCHTENGNPAIYGMEHHKPGRWLEFLCMEELD